MNRVNYYNADNKLGTMACVRWVKMTMYIKYSCIYVEIVSTNYKHRLRRILYYLKLKTCVNFLNSKEKLIPLKNERTEKTVALFYTEKLRKICSESIEQYQ